jgi:DNA-binding transcriptional LysR family regulator
MGVTDLDIDLLRAFVTVNETGSFTRASEKLHRTQSAVSLRIRRLEDLVGKQLIERGHNDLKLTPHGLELERYARLMLRLNDRALLKIGEADRRKSVSIGVPESFVPTLLPPLWQAVESFFPNSVVTVVCDVSAKLKTMFRDGDIDMAIVAERPDPKRSTTIFIDDLRWVRAPETRFDLRTALPLALCPEGCFLRESGIAALQSANLPFRIVESTRNFLVLKTAVLRGAVTVLAQHTISNDLEVVACDLPSLPQLHVAFYSGLQHAEAIRTLLREKLIDSPPRLPSSRPGPGLAIPKQVARVEAPARRATSA